MKDPFQLEEVCIGKKERKKEREKERKKERKKEALLYQTIPYYILLS